MNNIKHIVKRGGHSEPYDEKKFYASIFAACFALRESSSTCELIADKVTKELAEWIKNKHEVTSDDLRRKGSELLEFYNADAGHVFKNQRNLGR